MNDDQQKQMRRATGELLLAVLLMLIVIGGGIALLVQAERFARGENSLGVHIVFPEGWQPVASYTEWGWVCVNDEAVYRACKPHAVDAP